MTDESRLKILLLAHDLSDAAIARRVYMLQKGGASVTIAGFRRTEDPVALVSGRPAVNFGRTTNGGFAQRIAMVLRTLARLKQHRALFADTDVILARNLEMLALAVAGARLKQRPPAVIYEILDIHRLLLGSGLASRVLRGLERFLLRRTRAIITSSPAFITQYLQKTNAAKLPVRLVENKFLAPPEATATQRNAPPPWIIGWFGIIRCKKSLQILADLARQNKDRVEIVIRGKPALDQIPDFYNIVTSTPGLHFDGAYKYPDDLAAMYNAVHFNWTIDLYEEGLNSSWLLPNRIYEGGAYGAVPIASKAVETGDYLRKLGIGVLLSHPLAASLNDFFASLTAENYAHLAEAVRAVPSTQWICTGEECKDIVRFIAKAAHD